jgi:hypothetical protein
MRFTVPVTNACHIAIVITLLKPVFLCFRGMNYRINKASPTVVNFAQVIANIPHLQACLQVHFLSPNYL